MATVIVSWTTKEQEFPGVVVPGRYRVTIAPSSFPPQEVIDTNATFENVDPGAYIATVVRLDSDNNDLGDSVSKAFIVQPVSTVVNVPDVVEVSIS